MARISQELKQETKDAIIQAATELFSIHGFEKTKTKAIAQQCNIAEGTLFNYFPTKDDLLVNVFETMANVETSGENHSAFTPQDVILNRCLAPIKSLHKISKSLLLDLMLSSMKLAKKKPGLFKRLAKLDLDYMAQLETQLNALCTFKGSELNAALLSEMIYGIVASDYLMYLYAPSAAFETYENKVRLKVNAIVSPYIKEELM